MTTIPSGAVQVRANGTGTLTDSLTNGGLVSIGGSSGSLIGGLTVTGNYDQSAAGSLTVQIGGLTAGTQFDRLTVNGPVTLDGTLNLSLANGFNPAVGNTFQIIVLSASDVGPSRFPRFLNSLRILPIFRDRYDRRPRQQRRRIPASIRIVVNLPSWVGR